MAGEAGGGKTNRNQVRRKDEPEPVVDGRRNGSLLLGDCAGLEREAELLDAQHICTLQLPSAAVREETAQTQRP